MLDGDISKEEKEEYIVGLNDERNRVENELEKTKTSSDAPRSRHRVCL